MRPEYTTPPLSPLNPSSPWPLCNRRKEKALYAVVFSPPSIPLRDSFLFIPFLDDGLSRPPPPCFFSPGTFFEVSCSAVPLDPLFERDQLSPTTPPTFRDFVFLGVFFSIAGFPILVSLKTIWTCPIPTPRDFSRRQSDHGR